MTIVYVVLSVLILVAIYKVRYHIMDPIFVVFFAPKHMKRDVKAFYNVLQDPPRLLVPDPDGLSFIEKLLSS